jgi:type I restriction enzyme S subunit
MVKTGFKQTDVGVIPEDWEVKLLPDILRFRGGKAHEQHISDTGSYVCVNSKFISTDGEVRKYSSVNLCLAKKGDVLMVMSDLPNGRALAKTYLVEADDTYAVNQRVCALSAYKDHPKYFFYSLNRHPYFLKFDDGVSQTHLLNNIFQKCLVVIPTLIEQQAIATALSDADELIESLEQLLTKKRQIKQGAMQELLTGKKRLPGFSGEWEVKKLGEVVDADPENLSSDTRPDLEFNYIALEDVDRGFLRSNSVQVFANAPSRARRKLRNDDVLVSTVRPNLQSHLLFTGKDGRWVCSTGFCVVRCREGVTHPGYVFYHLFAGSVNKQIDALLTGSNYPAINSGDVRALQIPIPDYAEQTAIAEVLSDMDAEIEALETKLTKARQVKQGMMQELLTGRIRLV